MIKLITMSNVLVQICNKKLYSVIRKRFLKKNDESTWTFKLKNSNEEVMCKILGENDDRPMLIEMAKLLNHEVPYVQLSDDFNESIQSAILSQSYLYNNCTSSREIEDNDNFDITSIPVYYVDENDRLVEYQDFENNIKAVENFITNEEDLVKSNESITKIICNETDTNEIQEAGADVFDTSLDHCSSDKNDTDNSTSSKSYSSKELVKTQMKSMLPRRSRSQTRKSAIPKEKKTNGKQQLNSDESETSQDETNKQVLTRSRQRQNSKSLRIVTTYAEKLQIDKSGKLNIDDINQNVLGSPCTNLKQKYVPRSNVLAKRESKIHVCFICEEKIKDKIKRHIANCHKDNNIVQSLSELSELEYSNTMTMLVNLGDYNANLKNSLEKQELYGARKLNKKQIVHGKIDELSGEYSFPIKPRLNKATVILKTTSDDRQVPVIHNFELPAEETSASYVPCRYCLKYLKKSFVRKHKCPMGTRIENSKGFLRECENLIPDIHSDASNRLRNLVLKKMAPGEIKDIVKRDHFIILYGNDLVDYYNKDQNYAFCSHKLRLLAELVIHMRKQNGNIKFLKDVLKRENATYITEVLKIMAEHDVTNGLVKKVNKIPETTGLLIKLLKFFKAYYIEHHKDESAKDIAALQDVMSSKFKNLNKKSRDSFIEQTKDKPVQKVPKLEDIEALHSYAEKIRLEAVNTLNKISINSSETRTIQNKALKDLNESTLLLIQLFNRRRQGEVSRLLLSDLNQSKIFRLDDACIGDEFMKLSEKSKIVARNYVRISIINKKGLRTVGLLIHARLLESINLIIKFRNKTLKNNKYVFAKESNDTSIDHYYEAYHIMRVYATNCGVKDSSTLRGTMLRKQLATMMYAVDINDDNLKDLANFLGHEMSVHKTYYRQRIPVRELITLTPLLEQAQGSKIAQPDFVQESIKVPKQISKNLNSPSCSEYEPSGSDDDDSNINSNRKIKDNFFQLQELEKLQKNINKKSKSYKNYKLGSDEENESTVAKKGKKTAWTTEEQNAVETFIKEEGIPDRITAAYILKMKKTYPVLNHRNITLIRAYIHNNGYLKK